MQNASAIAAIEIGELLAVWRPVKIARWRNSPAFIGQSPDHDIPVRTLRGDMPSVRRPLPLGDIGHLVHLPGFATAGSQRNKSSEVVTEARPVGGTAAVGVGVIVLVGGGAGRGRDGGERDNCRRRNSCRYRRVRYSYRSGDRCHRRTRAGRRTRLASSDAYDNGRASLRSAPEWQRPKPQARFF